MTAVKLTYVPPFVAEGHDPGCSAHYLEACDCASGIVRAIELAFSEDLKRILSRSALQEASHD